MRRTTILAAWLIALSVGANAQQAPDSSRGIQLAGKLTFEPKVDPTVGPGTLFKVIATSGETIELLLSNVNVNSPASISAAWSRVLSPSDWAAIGFVNIALHGAVPVGHPETMTRCLPLAVSRNEVTARFALQCLGNDDRDIEKKNAAGKSIVEFTIAITTATNSRADSFFRDELRRPDEHRGVRMWLDR